MEVFFFSSEIYIKSKLFLVSAKHLSIAWINLRTIRSCDWRISVAHNSRFAWKIRKKNLKKRKLIDKTFFKFSSWFHHVSAISLNIPKSRSMETFCSMNLSLLEFNNNFFFFHFVVFWIGSNAPNAINHQPTLCIVTRITLKITRTNDT
jgi:hypothetical protein